MKRERDEYEGCENAEHHGNAKQYIEQNSTGPGELVGRDAMHRSHFFAANSNKATQRDLLHYAYKKLCEHLNFLSYNDNHFGIVVDYLADNAVNGYNAAKTAAIRQNLVAKLQHRDDTISEGTHMDYVTTLLDLATAYVKKCVASKFGDEALASVLAAEHTKPRHKLCLDNMPEDFTYYDTLLSALSKLDNVPCEHDLLAELDNLISTVESCFYENEENTADLTL